MYENVNRPIVVHVMKKNNNKSEFEIFKKN